MTTSSEETESWFSSTLLRSYDEKNSGAWWQDARTESPIGILVAVDEDLSATTSNLDPRHKVTELLFYAAGHASTDSRRPPTPPQSSPVEDGLEGSVPSEVGVFALPLSSDLLADTASELTPPPSPKANDDHVEGIFLPNETSHEPEAVNELPVKKRRNVSDTFDEAAERRRKARRKGGQAVAAAAAAPIKTEDSIPALQHRRSISSTHGPVQTRPLSRSSSVASTRPVLAREPSAKPSSLSQIQTADAASQSPQQPSIEVKNKELVGKMVMAGMRLLGLHRSKTRKSRSNSVVASPSADSGFDVVEADRKNDEEYMLVYNQAYKGTCCAFRQYMTTTSLQGQETSLRDTVDRLLAIFCNDPLTVETQAVEDEFTPGGRKAFGSSALPISEHANPFLQAAMTGRESQANTPSFRKSKGKEKAPT